MVSLWLIVRQGVYDKKKIMFMKMFEGHWKVEPVYVDSERLCMNMKPRTREEYREWSGGQGKIASKVTVGGVFQPSSIFNLPPVSWFIRGITVKTTKALLQDFLNLAAAIRGVWNTSNPVSVDYTVFVETFNQCSKNHSIILKL